MQLYELYKLIRRFEGFRAKPYLCPANVPTIGYGSTGPDITLATPPVTLEWAEGRMQREATLYAKAVLKLSPTLVSNNLAISAMADFSYNLGLTRYKASTLRRRIQAGDIKGAKEELAKWVFGGGRKLPGLIARRAAEALLLS